MDKSKPIENSDKNTPLPSNRSSSQKPIMYYAESSDNIALGWNLRITPSGIAAWLTSFAVLTGGLLWLWTTGRSTGEMQSKTNAQINATAAQVARLEKRLNHYAEDIKTIRKDSLDLKEGMLKLKYDQRFMEDKVDRLLQHFSLPVPKRKKKRPVHEKEDQ